MRPADIGKLPMPPADQNLSYGQDTNQIGELRLPAGPGPHPIVVLVHGGCWMPQAARYLAAMGDELKKDGIASWNIEYRRIGQPGGGWPGTYLDVGHAIDHLRDLAAPYMLDLDRVVVLGHSAGGHLAMWAGTRHRIDARSPLFIPRPLPIRGVINLAGTIDMTEPTSPYLSRTRVDAAILRAAGDPMSAVRAVVRASAGRARDAAALASYIARSALLIASSNAPSAGRSA